MSTTPTLEEALQKYQDVAAYRRQCAVSLRYTRMCVATEITVQLKTTPAALTRMANDLIQTRDALDEAEARYKIACQEAMQAVRRGGLPSPTISINISQKTVTFYNLQPPLPEVLTLFPGFQTTDSATEVLATQHAMYEATKDATFPYADMLVAAMELLDAITTTDH